MTVTLGELYEVVHHRLEQVTSVSLPRDDPFAHALALKQLDTLIGHVHHLLRRPEDRIDAAADDTFRHLHHARRALEGASRWLPPALARRCSGRISTITTCWCPAWGWR